jgi:MFS family permease
MRRRSIAVLLASAYLARVPVTAIPLALILLVREVGGSYAFAGLATGAYTLCLAVTAPLLGRIADRVGTGPVLAVGGPLCAVALLALAAGAGTLPGAAFVALAGLAGAVLPPLGPFARALFPRMLTGPPLARLYAIDAAAQELAFILGPLLIAGLVAVTTPSRALVAVAILLATGVAVFGAISARVPGGAERDGQHHRSPLRSASLRAVLVVTFLIGCGFGTIELAIPAAMDAAGERGSSGLVLAAWSLGSMLGGALAAARVADDPVRRLVAVLAASVVIGAILPFAAYHPDWLIPLLVVHGATLAPALAVMYGLVPSAVQGRLTEAFSWLSTAIVGGIAAGTAIAGVAVDAVGVPAGFALGALAALAALGVALVAARGTWAAPGYSPSPSSARIL